jgi:hypothetical protein
VSWLFYINPPPGYWWVVHFKGIGRYVSETYLTEDSLAGQ